MEQEISLLKQEISRLECLNRLLLDRIMALEQLISPSGKGVGDNNSSLSPYNQMQGDNEHSLSLSNILQGDKEHYLSLSKNMQGDNERSLSLSNIMQGNKEDYLSPYNKMQGDKEGVLSPMDGSDGGEDVSGQASINNNNDQDLLLVKRIRQSLAEGDMKGARHKMIKHAAAALLYVSRGGWLDYHYAVKAFGYSDAGATKFIIALQRRGFLERKAGRRQIFLTEKGRKHLPG